MGWELRGVVEAKKGRERERIEKQRPAMTMWREVGGEESPREGKREAESERGENKREQESKRRG